MTINRKAAVPCPRGSSPRSAVVDVGPRLVNRKGRLILGIDPGLSGAYAVLDPSGNVVALEDLPVIRDGRLAWIDAEALLPWLCELTCDRAVTAVVERQQAMPKQGVSSSFTTGVAFGSLLAVLQTAGVSIELVTAGKWKRAMGLLKVDKRASLDKARLLFPSASLDRQKDHGRAEALLLAYWRLNRAAQSERDETAFRSYDGIEGT